MSDADRVNQVEPVEGQPEIPSPDQTDNVEDFDKALDNERGNISKSVREDDYFQERADELSDNKSPDEIRYMYDQLGDPTDKEDAYKDAVLGDHPDWTDKQRSETIESAKSDWENDVATREIYAMAMENHGEELTEADKAGENGKIFGSITSKEIATELKNQYNVEVDKKKVVLKEPKVSFYTLLCRILKEKGAVFRRNLRQSSKKFLLILAFFIF